MKTVYLQMLALSVCLSSCSSYSRQDEVWKQRCGNDVYNILHYASLAASSHNTQPWKVEVYGMDSLAVFPDFSRKLTVIDPHSRELFVSLGAFIENLDIAANHLGYITDIQLNKKDCTENDSTFITVSLRRGKKQNIDVDELAQRRVLRSSYDTMQIAESDAKQLISANSDAIHFVPARSPKGAYIRSKTIEAYTTQAQNENVQDELAKWIRFSNVDAKEKNDGLTTSSMEIKGIAGFFVRNFFKPKDSKKGSFVSQGIEKTRAQVEHCGGWILVTQKENTPACWINTGRIFQRLHIECYKLKIGLQPMTQLIEEADFEKPANNELAFGDPIQFVARVGYVKEYTIPVSVRRPVESFTIFK